MIKIVNNKSISENLAQLEKLTKPHIDGLLIAKKKDYKKKILETQDVGKFLMLLDKNITIEEVTEIPDFIIKLDTEKFGLEHQILVDEKSKEREGFFENIFISAEAALKSDPDLPCFLANCYIKPYTNFKLREKTTLINTVKHVVKEFILTDILIDNPLIDRISKMPHSGINISGNLGAWWQKDISQEIIQTAINKKEQLIETYVNNCGETLWLLIVIGSVGNSSYIINPNLEFSIKSKFDKIYLLEDVYNNLYELK